MPTTSLKNSVRKEKLAQREALPPEVHAELSHKLCGHLQTWLQVHSSLDIAAYLPTRNEPDILPVMQNIRVALPVVNETRVLTFHTWRLGDTLLPNRFGIGEPDARANIIVPDLVLVPCVAFDAKGYRIGYRGGYYDATLHHLRGQKKITALGIAFDFQRVPEIPYDPHDERLDGIVTEYGYFSAA